jgi:hypothetical protein
MTGGQAQILRFAQNDKFKRMDWRRNGDQSDKHRFFAALRMTSLREWIGGKNSTDSSLRSE